MTTTTKMIMKKVIIMIIVTYINSLLYSPTSLAPRKEYELTFGHEVGSTRDILGIWGRKGNLYIVAGLLLLILVVMSH